MIFYQRRFDISDMRTVHIEINGLLILQNFLLKLFNINILNNQSIT